LKRNLIAEPVDTRPGGCAVGQSTMVLETTSRSKCVRFWFGTVTLSATSNWNVQMPAGVFVSSSVSWR
jgi:hypothetical protein